MRVLQVPSGFVYATIMTYSEWHKTTPPHQNYVGQPHHELEVLQVLKVLQELVLQE